MAARVTLKAINDELTKRGHNARLEKASGYFFKQDYKVRVLTMSFNYGF